MICFSKNLLPQAGFLLPERGEKKFQKKVQEKVGRYICSPIFALPNEIIGTGKALKDR